MTTIFITLLNMSVTAGVTALAVMLARAAFKKLPKRLTCALWALVGLRLTLPFSWESALSLIPRASTVRETVGRFTVTAGTSPAPVSGGTEYFTASNFIPPQPRSVPAAEPFDWVGPLTWVWIAGVAAMLAYLLVSAVMLKRRVGASVETEPGVFVADGLSSPFVLGVFRPKIYLPSSLDAAQKEMILAHERAHLQRRDHLIKPFAFLLLSVYWFNPVLWIAYALLCRDIELACDERVIRDMDRNDRAFYSQTLLDCGSGHRRIAACPVAFGEVGVKERVKNVLNYKKPAFWILLIAVIAGIVLAVCFLTNPKTKEDRLTGVRLTMSDMLETMRCYDITESGELIEAEYYTVGNSTRYNAASDCFDYDASEGKLKTRLVKTELTDTTHTPVEVTDTHRAIFEAVSGLDKYIHSMSIFESHHGDDRYFVAVAYQEDMDTFCDVFQFNESKGSLKKLCRIADMPGSVFVAADVETPEEAVDRALKLDYFHYSSDQTPRQGEFYSQAHHTYGMEQKDGKTIVYTVTRQAEFGFINGYFTDVSGSMAPTVITFGSYMGGDSAVATAKDGALYASSIREMFPKEYADEILKHGDKYNEELWDQLKAQAEEYLASIGRTAEVRKTSEVGLSTLTDYGVSVEVANRLANSPQLADYPFYGTQEKIENGVRYVYRTSYDAETNRILYEKFPYGEEETLGLTEEIVIDAATGNVLSHVSVPIERLQAEYSGESMIDSAVCDIDGNGMEDRCVMSYGPTSGLFTFYLTVTPEGASGPKYQSIFLTDYSDLSFVEVKKDMELYVRAQSPLIPSQEKLYHVLIENGGLTLRSDDGDMDRWAGESQVIGQEQLRKQFPELFALNADKGLDVFVWKLGEGIYYGWLAERGAYAVDDLIYAPFLEHFNDLTPEDIKAILACYGLPAKKINVIPCQHPLSSYLWAQDGEIVDGDVTQEDLRAMFGL